MYTRKHHHIFFPFPPQTHPQVSLNRTPSNFVFPKLVFIFGSSPSSVSAASVCMVVDLSTKSCQICHFRRDWKKSPWDANPEDGFCSISSVIKMRRISHTILRKHSRKVMTPTGSSKVRSPWSIKLSDISDATVSQTGSEIGLIRTKAAKLHCPVCTLFSTIHHWSTSLLPQQLEMKI